MAYCPRKTRPNERRELKQSLPSEPSTKDWLMIQADFWKKLALSNGCMLRYAPQLQVPRAFMSFVVSLVDHMQYCNTSIRVKRHVYIHIDVYIYIHTNSHNEVTHFSYMQKRLVPSDCGWALLFFPQVFLDVKSFSIIY